MRPFTFCGPQVIRRQYLRKHVSFYRRPFTHVGPLLRSSQTIREKAGLLFSRPFTYSGLFYRCLITHIGLFWNVLWTSDNTQTILEETRLFLQASIHICRSLTQVIRRQYVRTQVSLISVYSRIQVSFIVVYHVCRFLLTYVVDLR